MTKEHKNKFEMLKETHPKLYDYCMRGGCYDEQGLWKPNNGLGMQKVIDFVKQMEE